jgi:hypothetical protein
VLSSIGLIAYIGFLFYGVSHFSLDGLGQFLGSHLNFSFRHGSNELDSLSHAESSAKEHEKASHPDREAINQSQMEITCLSSRA